ncbi:MAG: recombination-associated protein RdgC [Plesiomonas sp.]
MIFSLAKEMSIYRVTKPLAFSDEENKKFESFEFFPRNPSSHSSSGWAPIFEQLTHSYFIDRAEQRENVKTNEPISDMVSPLMVYQSGNHVVLRAVQESASIPSAQIEQKLSARVSEIERFECRTLRKPEKDSIKEGILASLLPAAYTKRVNTILWYNKATGLLVVFAGATRAESTLALLRKTLGTLPVIPVRTKSSPTLIMTQWVKDGDLPSNFCLSDAAELCSPLKNGGIVRFKDQCLVCDEVKQHIENQKLVTKLEMSWSDRMKFTVTDNLAITKIKWDESLAEQNDDIDRDDMAARIDADIALLTGELTAFIKELLSAFGGEDKTVM